MAQIRHYSTVNHCLVARSKENTMWPEDRRRMTNKSLVALQHCHPVDLTWKNVDPGPITGLMLAGTRSRRAEDGIPYWKIETRTDVRLVTFDVVEEAFQITTSPEGKCWNYLPNSGPVAVMSGFPGLRQSLDQGSILQCQNCRNP
ncbi:OLC1v1023470C1 [Oldenlandia corymbosa var. corymbosa]|uniref:OLC1v1023470C1 n=1 Tax=Oldenlandia corymbosa var. corymbosa TaxID=529605 RepID=A0AAV1C2Z1_OLDCO|nr:OLC1v1023470C1 [Oldenlandia corymbosa var. corymbosa]